MLGAPQNGSFGWCNEFGETIVEVPEFAIDKYPITNRQFLDFVETGGYQNKDYWSAAGWSWIASSERAHPQFWLRSGRKWLFKEMFDVIELPEHHPAWVAHAEAEAYARWKHGRLMTEAEFHRAAYGTDNGERAYPWGQSAPDETKGNFGLRRMSPLPVGSTPDGASYFGVEELVGNGWEWTSTAFRPFPGFERLQSYPGYSADFFDERHFVLKGGSPLTADRLLRKTFRNWFQPHYPYVYAKFRCAYSMNETERL
jgi:formylglycine-generating enzyme required for sulfatase activity